MRLKPFAAAILAFLLGTSLSYARKASSHPHHEHASSTFLSHYHSHRAAGVARDSHGRIKRSASAKRKFEKESGYPKGRPGYVVDHVVPLKRGGADDPSNMQWQTKEEAKEKDKWE